MARVNDHYLKLRSSYLFSEIARRVREFQDAHPGARLIRLGIGDVTRPLAPAVITALHGAVDEMARAETFKGYGPETGYAFLTELIAQIKAAAQRPDPGALAAWWSQIATWRAKDCLKYDRAAAIIKPQLVIEKLYEVTKGDAYVTSDFMWTRLLHHACRIQMFHGVGGKYGFDAPTESLRAWHRLFFVNRRRLRNCVAAGAVAQAQARWAAG